PTKLYPNKKLNRSADRAGKSDMIADAAIFVSKRLQRAAFAMLCLMAAQLTLALASCEAEPAAMAARVSLAELR
ncbi:MAG: hypothetical protein ACI9LT_002351, partial [Pseudoalteromonas distincta]